MSLVDSSRTPSRLPGHVCALAFGLGLLCGTGAIQIASAQPPRDHATAEYNRISHHLRELAERDAWSGVERSYREIRSLGVPLSFDDHLGGARSARALGDATSMRQRLVFANALQPGDHEVDGWLKEIGRSYGEVSLHCDPGKALLDRKGLPFDPNQQAAVKFAQLQVEQRGSFTGLLPAGDYAFGQFEFTVTGGIQTGTMDLRSDGYLRSLERAERTRSNQAAPKPRKKKSDEAEPPS
jgi:hypothetical protein